MSKLVFVQDGVLVSAPTSYGVIDSSIGGQLARKLVPEADGRTRRGLVAINNMRDRIGQVLKDYNPAVSCCRLVIG